MLQNSLGVKVNDNQFRPTYDHVRQELGDDAQRLLASIKAAVKALPPDPSSGTRRFAVLDLMHSIALSDQTAPLNPLHDMAERNLGSHDIARCEAFVEHHFALIVWFHLEACAETWVFANNFDAKSDRVYEQFNKTYTESPT